MRTATGARRVGRAMLVLAVLMVGPSATAGGPIRAQEAPGTQAQPPDVTLPDPLTPEAVREPVARLGDAQVRAIGPDLLEPLESRGVLSVETHGLIARAKFKTKPGEQFVVRHEVYQRVQKAFAQAGIPFATPPVSVRGPGPDDRGGEAAAAHAVVQAPVKVAAGG